MLSSWVASSLRHGKDYDNSEPSKAKKNNRIFTHFADAAGTADDPKLVVEHTTIVTPVPVSSAFSLTYEYDAVGNIIAANDSSDSSSTTVLYTYDDLYRLKTTSGCAGAYDHGREIRADALWCI